jgi:hypothetical protein
MITVKFAKCIPVRVRLKSLVLKFINQESSMTLATLTFELPKGKFSGFQMATGIRGLFFGYSLY